MNPELHSVKTWFRAMAMVLVAMIVSILPWQGVWFLGQPPWVFFFFFILVFCFAGAGSYFYSLWCGGMV